MTRHQFERRGLGTTLEEEWKRHAQRFTKRAAFFKGIKYNPEYSPEAQVEAEIRYEVASQIAEWLNEHLVEVQETPEQRRASFQSMPSHIQRAIRDIVMAEPLLKL